MIPRKFRVFATHHGRYCITSTIFNTKEEAEELLNKIVESVPEVKKKKMRW